MKNAQILNENTGFFPLEEKPQQYADWNETISRMIASINHKKVSALSKLYAHECYFKSSLFDEHLNYFDVLRFWRVITKSSKPVSAWIYSSDFKNRKVKYCISYVHPETNNSVMMDIESVIIVENGKITFQSDKVNHNTFIAYAYGIFGFCRSLLPGGKKYFHDRMNNYFNSVLFQHQ